MTDRQFMTVFVAVMGSLVIIGVLAFIMARIIAGENTGQSDDPIAQKQVELRIAPVGQVYVGSVPPEALVAAAGGADSEAGSEGAGFESGEDIYSAVCAACHGTGAAGAPKLDDKAAWSGRLTQGVDVLYQSAINGKGAMPPKGGRADLSDDDIKMTVDYMMETAS